MISFGFLVVGLTVVSNAYAAGNNNNKGKGNGSPIPALAPAPNVQQQLLQQLNQKKHNSGHPGSNGPVGQRPERPGLGQQQPWTCTKPPGQQTQCIKPGNGNSNTNGNGNGNWNGNKNGNANANANKNNNTNRINNSNDISIKLNLGKNDSGGTGTGTGTGTWDGNFGGGFNNGGYGGGYPSGGGGGYTAGGYSPTGGAYAPTFSYNNSYDFSGNGFGAMPVGVAAVGLPPVPNAVAFNEDDPNTAWVTLELPSEDAEVWLNGAKMPHKGLVRKYVTPPLEKDKIYNYEIKVQWPDKGRAKGAKLNYATMLQFKAGDEILHKVPVEGDGKAAAPAPNKEQNPQDEAKLMNQRLNWAKDLLKEGKKDKAKERLKEIVDKSPDSPAGKEAKELLSKID